MIEADKVINVDSLDTDLNIENIWEDTSSIPGGGNSTLIDTSRAEENQPENEFILLKLWLPLHFVPTIACVLSMLGITVCLYFTITRPLQHHIILSKRRGTVMVIAIWAVAFLGYLVHVICIWDQRLLINVDIISNLFQRVLWFVTLLIFLVMTVMYCVILCNISERRVGDSLVQRKANRKAIVVSLTVIISYALCHLPFLWYFLIEYVFTVDILDSQLIWKAVFSTTIILNTIIDSIVYALRLPEVSNGLRAKRKAIGLLFWSE